MLSGILAQIADLDLNTDGECKVKKGDRIHEKNESFMPRKQYSR